METSNCSAGTRAEGGFTLVEVLVASLIMLVAIFGLLAAIPQSYERTRDAGRTSILNHLAAETLEELLSRDYTDPALAPGVHPTFQLDSQGRRYYPVTGLDEDYSVRWTVTAGPTDGGGAAVPGLKSVFVEATYATRYSSAGAPLTDTRSIVSTTRTFIAE